MTGSAPEEWRDVPTHPQFEASSWGRARWKPFKATMHHGGERWYGGTATFGTVRKRDGRHVVNISRGGHRQIYVHKLVCAAFHGPPPAPGMDTMHADDNPQNNRPENLSWGTRAENARAPGNRAKKRALWASGRYYGRSSKLLPQQVQELKRRLASGERNCDLADEYGVSRTTVSHIRSGDVWAHIQI